MKPFVKFGLLNGALAIVWQLLMYITGLNRNADAQLINILSIAITIILMYLAVKDFRQDVGKGWIKFGKAFNISFMVGLIGGLISTTFYFIYISFIDKDFIDYQKKLQYDKMYEKGMSEEMVEKAMKQAETFMTPQMQFIFGLIFTLILSALLALVISAIMKKANPEEIN